MVDVRNLKIVQLKINDFNEKMLNEEDVRRAIPRLRRFLLTQIEN